MKKKLNEIFDEAKPQELDQFSDELKAPELSPEVLASVKGKVYAKTNLKKEKKTTKSVWLRFGAIAACFLLIVSAVIVVPMLREDEPGIIPGPRTTDDNNRPNIPIVNAQVPSSAPQYYGSEATGDGGATAEINTLMNMKRQARTIFARDFLKRGRLGSMRDMRSFISIAAAEERAVGIVFLT